MNKTILITTVVAIFLVTMSTANLNKIQGSSTIGSALHSQVFKGR